MVFTRSNARKYQNRHVCFSCYRRRTSTGFFTCEIRRFIHKIVTNIKKKILISLWIVNLENWLQQGNGKVKKKVVVEKNWMSITLLKIIDSNDIYIYIYILSIFDVALIIIIHDKFELYFVFF